MWLMKNDGGGEGTLGIQAGAPLLPPLLTIGQCLV